LCTPDQDNACVGKLNTRHLLLFGVLIFLKTMKNFIFLAFNLAILCMGNAQNKLTIKVISSSLEPIPMCLVKIQETDYSDFTDDNGLIQLKDIPSQNIGLIVNAFGYEPKLEKLDLTQIDNKHHFISIMLKAKYNILQEVQVEASRVNEKSGVAFQNVNAKTIKANNIGIDVPLFLNTQTSVVSTTDNGTGVGYSYMRIRGTDGQRTNVTVNGIPFNDAESQGVYFVNMPDLLSSVNSIQIQRGVGSATNGAGAFGASINMQTEGLNEKPYGEVALGTGSFGFNKQTIKAGTGLINDQFAADLRLSHIGTKGYIDRSGSELLGYFASLGYYGKNNNLKFISFSGNEVTRLSYNGISGAALSGNKDSLQRFYDLNAYYYPTQKDSLNLFNAGRTYNSFLYENEKDRYIQSHYQLHYAHRWENFRLNVSAHYTKGAGYFEQYKNDQSFKKYGLPNAISQIDSSLVKRSDIIRQKHLDNDFSGMIASFNYKIHPKVNLIAGGAYNYYNGRHFGKVLWSKVPTAFNTYPSIYYNNQAEKIDASAYLKTSIDLTQKLSMNAELQWRQVYYQLNGLADEQGVADTSLSPSFKPFLNPRLSFNYEWTPYFSLYAFYGRANKEPNRDDFKSSPYKQSPKVETLDNIEAGARYINDRLSLNLNYYLMNYKNQLVLTGLLNDVGDQYRTNVLRSQRQGVELDAQIKATKTLMIALNSTFSNNVIFNYTDIVPNYSGNDLFLIKTDYKQTPISYSPDLIANVNIQYEPYKYLQLMLNSKYVGKQYLDNTGSDNKVIPAYSMTDFRIAYTIKNNRIKQANIYLQLNNILNQKYVSNGYTVNYYYGSPQKYIDNYYTVQAPFNWVLGTVITF
jgi:iron complex outermembrane recepter protein